MLFEILGIAALWLLGYNCTKDEEHREKSKKALDSFFDASMKVAERKHNNNIIDDDNFEKIQNAYNNYKSKSNYSDDDNNNYY